jgi:membrane protein implicated in regulation of membrane protease activity
MIKKLGHILTYHDSEPTEVLQGLIWFIFAPFVLEAEFFPNLWYVAVLSFLIGFGTLYSVVYSSLERRRLFGYLYGSMAIIFVLIHFIADVNWTPMNWGWIVIAISALSNIRRITQKIESKKSDKETQDITKMYREDLEEKIEKLQKENFDMRLETLKLKESLDEK